VPHLHGILNRIGDLGLKLVSVESLPEEVHGSADMDPEQSRENWLLGFR
jgi:hypothetical protein